MVIYWCGDEFGSILCGVYDAWMSRLGHGNVKLRLKAFDCLEMFAEYRETLRTQEKIEKVTKAVKSKISEEALQWIYRASLSCDEDKADKIYRFLVYGFHYGKKVTEYLQIPEVLEIFKMNRNTVNEAHLLKEFVRFSEMKGGVLFSRIGPKNDVLPLITPHFADRLREEYFIIYDEKRGRASVHAPGEEWLLFTADSDAWRECLTTQTDEKEYEELWKVFHKSVAIKERENYVCQRTHLPLRFRPYMTEFCNISD